MHILGMVIGDDDLGEVKVVGVVNRMVSISLSSSHDDALLFTTVVGHSYDDVLF